MEKTYEAIGAKIFSFPVNIGGNDVRISFFNTGNSGYARYSTTSEEEQKAIESSRLFGRLVALVSEHPSDNTDAVPPATADAVPPATAGTVKKRTGKANSKNTV
jgi:hypothetical protein